jgi:hypothetical protein
MGLASAHPSTLKTNAVHKMLFSPPVMVVVYVNSPMKPISSFLSCFGGYRFESNLTPVAFESASQIMHDAGDLIHTRIMHLALVVYSKMAWLCVSYVRIDIHAQEKGRAPELDFPCE